MLYLLHLCDRAVVEWQLVVTRESEKSPFWLSELREGSQLLSSLFTVGSPPVNDYERKTPLEGSVGKLGKGFCMGRFILTACHGILSR